MKLPNSGLMSDRQRYGVLAIAISAIVIFLLWWWHDNRPKLAPEPTESSEVWVPKERPGGDWIVLSKPSQAMTEGLFAPASFVSGGRVSIQPKYQPAPMQLDLFDDAPIPIGTEVEFDYDSAGQMVVRYNQHIAGGISQYEYAFDDSIDTWITLFPHGENSNDAANRPPYPGLQAIVTGWQDTDGDLAMDHVSLDQVIFWNDDQRKLIDASSLYAEVLKANGLMYITAYGDDYPVSYKDAAGNPLPFGPYGRTFRVTEGQKIRADYLVDGVHSYVDAVAHVGYELVFHSGGYAPELIPFPMGPEAFEEVACNSFPQWQPSQEDFQLPTDSCLKQKENQDFEPAMARAGWSQLGNFPGGVVYGSDSRWVDTSHIQWQTLRGPVKDTMTVPTPNGLKLYKIVAEKDYTGKYHPMVQFDGQKLWPHWDSSIMFVRGSGYDVEDRVVYKITRFCEACDPDTMVVLQKGELQYRGG